MPVVILMCHVGWEGVKSTVLANIEACEQKKFAHQNVRLLKVELIEPYNSDTEVTFNKSSKN